MNKTGQLISEEDNNSRGNLPYSIHGIVADGENFIVASGCSLYEYNPRSKSMRKLDFAVEGV